METAADRVQVEVSLDENGLRERRSLGEEAVGWWQGHRSIDTQPAATHTHTHTHTHTCV